MPRTFLYLDDEEPEVVRPFIREVERGSDGVAIELAHPRPYRDQIDALMGGEFDGLILDLRLDQYAGWKAGGGAEKADYRASTLAQEIRTRAAESSSVADKRGRGEYPIVLWSTDERLDTSYARDHTSHDLFDLLCVKDHILSDDDDVADEKKATWVAKRLLALADGYDFITKVRNDVGRKRGHFFRFLGYGTRPDFLDPRLVDLEPFDQRLLFRPAHEYARFIRRELLEVTGPLIDRHTLAARLGLDVEQSRDADGLITDHFRDALYGGPFAKGWPRWWAAEVEILWRDLASQNGDLPTLRSLAAPDRVELVRKHTGLKHLKAAEPLSKGGSTRYWVACRATGHPLDPRDGFVLDSRKRFPWQGDEYVSLHAVINGLLKTHELVLSPLERERAERAKSRLA